MDDARVTVFHSTPHTFCDALASVIMIQTDPCSTRLSITSQNRVHIVGIIGGWGGESNREIVSFRSCVRASGRGEAKLRGRARGDESPVARALTGPVTSSTPAPPRPVLCWVVPLVVPLVVPPVVPPVLCWVVPLVVLPCCSVLGCPAGCPAGCLAGCPVGCLVSVSCRVSQIVIR